MNLILLESMSHKQKLAADDRRSVHIREILKRSSITELYVGYPNGPLGMALVNVLGDGDVELTIVWKNRMEPETQRSSLSLIVPFCRPQTCRKILRDTAPLGLSRVVFFASEKGEPAYADSKLWSSGEWKEQLRLGVEQSFDTQIPEVDFVRKGLSDTLSRFDRSTLQAFAFDNYESEVPFGPGLIRPGQDQLLVVGSERGWSSRERDLFRENQITMVHMGHRVLRTETAIVSAAAVANACRGDWRFDTSCVGLS